MPSTYLRRMYTDTVSPHAMGVKFAIDFYGVDHVLYGDDTPCWNTASALRVFDEVELSDEDRRKILYDNARGLLNLRDQPAPARVDADASPPIRSTASRQAEMSSEA